MIAYFVVSFLWGIFATLMNKKVHAEARKSQHVLCFIINVMVCPIALVVVIVFLVSGKHDKYFKV